MQLVHDGLLEVRDGEVRQQREQENRAGKEREHPVERERGGAVDDAVLLDLAEQLSTETVGCDARHALLGADRMPRGIAHRLFTSNVPRWSNSPYGSLLP